MGSLTLLNLLRNEAGTLVHESMDFNSSYYLLRSLVIDSWPREGLST